MTAFIRLQQMCTRIHSQRDDAMVHLLEHEINLSWGLHEVRLYSVQKDFMMLGLDFSSIALLCHSGQTDSLSVYASVALGNLQHGNDPLQFQELLTYFWCVSDMNQCFNGNLNGDHQSHFA